MGWYAKRIFPWVLDRVMSRAEVSAQRAKVLGDARGDILEIGFGTGLNLPHYSADVRRLTALEPNPGMRRRAERRVSAFPIRVEYRALLDGGRLPASDAQFDTVVSTWTLCTIPDAPRALNEIHRVLRPGGRFLFIEHGRSPDPKLAAWQRRLNFVSRCLGDGCHLDRDIAGLLAASPLHVKACDQFYMPHTLRIGGFTFRGSALK